MARQNLSRGCPMVSIEVSQDQLEYVGLLATPAFTLLSDPEKIVGGLYYAFLGLHTGLGDFQTEGTGVLQQTVINLHTRGTYRFSVERVEWQFLGAGLWELDPSPLVRGDSWLRSAVSGLKFKNHYITYAAHTWMREGTARDFLLSHPRPHLVGFGEDHGTGLIFHGYHPDRNWSVHLTIDHSNLVQNGLFLQMVVVIAAESIDYVQTIRVMDELFRRAIAQLGLDLVRSVG
jgi:hypothetical protein